MNVKTLTRDFDEPLVKSFLTETGLVSSDQKHSSATRIKSERYPPYAAVGHARPLRRRPKPFDDLGLGQQLILDGFGQRIELGVESFHEFYCPAHGPRMSKSMLPDPDSHSSISINVLNIDSSRPRGANIYQLEQN
jgi:hypothetical protein